MKLVGPQNSLVTAVLTTTMASATFSLVVFGVLASELIAVFDVSRQQIGYLVSATGLVGAVSSPLIGPLADHFGARRATLTTLAVSAGSLAAVALAPTYAMLLVAAAATGLAQAGGNPSTNKLIAQRIAAGRRGVITGIKQSGVQMGVFVGGLALPPLSIFVGWRWAVLAFALVPAMTLGLTLATLAPDPESATDEVLDHRRWRPSSMVMRLAVYGLLLGAGGSAITTYLALYGQEVLGVSSRVAGLTVSVVGVVGIVGRILWGRVAEHGLGPGRSLETIAILAAITSAALALAPTFGVAMLWLAAAGAGLSAVAWNVVGMLAVILHAPHSESGRASGVVVAGFLAGVGVGAPAMGRSVDVLGVYGPGWWTTGLVFLTAWMVIRGTFTA